MACHEFYEDKVPQAFFTFKLPRKLKPNSPEEIESIIEKYKENFKCKPKGRYRRLFKELIDYGKD